MDNKKNVILFVSSNIILDYDKELYDNVKIVNLDLPLDELFKEAAKAELDGSHATGLDYVPFDGYIAELHKGERVQTASEVMKDNIISQLATELKSLREITLKTASETTRTSKLLDRLSPDGDALQVRSIA